MHITSIDVLIPIRAAEAEVLENSLNKFNRLVNIKKGNRNGISTWDDVSSAKLGDHTPSFL